MNLTLLLGILLGVVLTFLLVGAGAFLVFPKLMLHERPSPLGLDETVEKITQTALAA